VGLRRSGALLLLRLPWRFRLLFLVLLFSEGVPCDLAWRLLLRIWNGFVDELAEGLHAGIYAG
jgi:hypothetical protein